MLISLAAAVVPSPIQNPTLSLPVLISMLPALVEAMHPSLAPPFPRLSLPVQPPSLWNGESPAEKIPTSMAKKLKAYLRRGAKALQGSEKLPNDLIGWGEDVIIRLH